MQQFFVEFRRSETDRIHLDYGSDVNHMKNVLRMKTGRACQDQ
ncbi:MAG: hypothetical protein ACLRUZ_07700 [Faecalimonas sp.]